MGYPLYLAFLGGAVCGLGVGAIMPFRNVDSLRSVLPRIQRNLTVMSLASYSLFMLIVGYGILFSNLTLRGY